MKKIWRDHTLLIILCVILLIVLILGTWATWFEYAHNEQGFPEGHHAFWSESFAAYWSMQLLMNYAPEIMGSITMVILAAEFREKFLEKKDDT